MPKIERTSAGSTPHMTAIPISQGGGYAAPGRALQGFGNTLSQVGAQFQAEQEKQDRFESQTKLTEFYNQERLALDQSQYNYQGDGKTYASEHLSGFNQRAQEVLGSIPASQQKQLAPFVERIRGQIALGAQNFGQRKLLEYNSGLAQQTIKSISANVSDFASVEAGLAQSQQVISQIPGMNARQQAVLREHAGKVIVDSYMGKLDSVISDPRAPTEARTAAVQAKASALEILREKRAAQAPDTAQGPSVTPTLSAYSPQVGGSKMEGGYAASRKGPDGKAEVRTLEDVAAGRSDYVTLAGNPKEYGREFTIPKINYIDKNGKQQTLTNVKAVVHDTGSAFKNAPEGRYDLAAGKDLDEKTMAANHAAWKGVQFIAKDGGGGTIQGPTGKQVELPTGNTSAFDLAKKLLGGNERQHASILSEVFRKAAGQNIDPRKTPWCAAFVNAVIGASGSKGTGSLAARSFLNYGQATKSPSEGDIVVLSRGSDPSKGHVGFYAGRDANGNILVLGGNQGDKVSVAPYAASRVLGFRKIPDAGSALPPGSTLPPGAQDAGAQGVRQGTQVASTGAVQIPQANIYEDAELAKHAKTLQKQIEGLTAEREFLAIASGEVIANPHDDDTAKLMDKRTDASGIAQRIFAGDPTAVEGATRLVQNYGRAPDGIGRAIHGLVTHPQDLGKRALGYQMMESILAVKPDAFAAHPQGKAMVASYEEFQAERMFTPDAHEAMKKIAARSTPEWEAKAEARKKVGEEKAKDISWEDVQAATGWSWMGRRVEGDVVTGNYNDGAAVLLSHYRDRFKTHYTATGNVETAKAMVGLEFRRTYQDSRLFGRATVMRHAPDKLYPPLPEDAGRAAERNHKWIDKQAKEFAGRYIASYGEMGSGEEPEPAKIEDGEIALLSDATTEREVRAGRPPSYLIRVRNPYYKKLGMDMDDILQLRFTPDARLAAEDVTGAREEKFKAARTQPDQSNPDTPPVARPPGSEPDPEFLDNPDAPHMAVRRALSGLLNTKPAEGDKGINPDELKIRGRR